MSDLFDFPDTPRVRRSDPLSSHAAADKVAPFLKGQRMVIYEAVAAHPGRTSEELEKVCTLNYAQIARRLGEMQQHNLVRRVDRGSNAALWFVNDGGDAE